MHAAKKQQNDLTRKCRTQSVRSAFKFHLKIWWWFKVRKNRKQNCENFTTKKINNISHSTSICTVMWLAETTQWWQLKHTVWATEQSIVLSVQLQSMGKGKFWSFYKNKTNKSSVRKLDYVCKNHRNLTLLYHGLLPNAWNACFFTNIILTITITRSYASHDVK